VRKDSAGAIMREQARAKQLRCETVADAEMEESAANVAMEESAANAAMGGSET